MRREFHKPILVSIVVSIPACHAGDRGSIPRRGGTPTFFFSLFAFSLYHQLQFHVLFGNIHTFSSIASRSGNEITIWHQFYTCPLPRIVGSVVECSPATRAARVRFPDDASDIFFHFFFPSSLFLPSLALICFPSLLWLLVVGSQLQLLSLC